MKNKRKCPKCFLSNTMILGEPNSICLEKVKSFRDKKIKKNATKLWYFGKYVPEYQHGNKDKNRILLDDKFQHQQLYQQEYFHFFQFYHHDFDRKV